LTLALSAAVEAHRAGSWMAVDPMRDPTVRTGDQVQLTLRASEEVFLYVFLYSTGDQRAVALFPRSAGASARVGQGEAVVLPEPGRFFRVYGPAGAERFYILAARERRPEVETLVAELDDQEAARRKTAQTESGVVLLRLRSMGYEQVELTHLEHRSAPVASAPDRSILRMELQAILGAQQAYSTIWELDHVQ
jgi:hypothetical protein